MSLLSQCSKDFTIMTASELLHFKTQILNKIEDLDPFYVYQFVLAFEEKLLPIEIREELFVKYANTVYISGLQDSKWRSYLEGIDRKYPINLFISELLLTNYISTRELDLAIVLLNRLIEKFAYVVVLSKIKDTLLNNSINLKNKDFSQPVVSLFDIIEVGILNEV